MQCAAWSCRAYCTRSHNSAAISSDEERVIWIPARLLVAASRDTEVYSFILDTVFRQGLFSAKLPIEAAARQWGVVFMSCPEQDRSALMAVLRAKARAQQDVQAFLTIRGARLMLALPDFCICLHIFSANIPHVTCMLTAFHLCMQCKQCTENAFITKDVIFTVRTTQAMYAAYQGRSCTQAYCCQLAPS